MMEKIRIQLMSDLCVGNGESVGYGVDSDICKDNYGFPYIPSRRLLGCLKEATEQLKEYGLVEATEKNINEIYGTPDGKEGKLRISDAIIPEVDSLHRYILSLKNEEPQRDYLIRQSTEDRIIRSFSSIRGQTKIGENGKADNGSLRFVRVLNRHNPFSGDPMIFECSMDSSQLNDSQKILVKKSCKTLRHIGLERNRGLGNIIADIISDEKADTITKKAKLTPLVCGDVSSIDTDQIFISYQVEFDSPVTIQEYLEFGSQIQSRTMIGVFASKYIDIYQQTSEEFQHLFLDGTVRWSSLTPVINDMRSDPAPASLMILKNGGGKIVNSFTCSDTEWKKKKPKGLDGYYSIVNENGTCYVVKPETETYYHNRINHPEGNNNAKKGLYTQEALKRGMIYAGYILLPKNLSAKIIELLTVNKDIRLGRSKKVQYGRGIINNINISAYDPDQIFLENNEIVFAILKSDLVFQENAEIRVDCAYVRERIAAATGLNNNLPDSFNDICRYHVVSGYNAMWQMQKPKIQTVMGGSIYCFQGVKGIYPSKIQIGEYQQEGFGIIELLPLRQFEEIKSIKNGNIQVKDAEVNEKTIREFENSILYRAAIEELEEYAFRFINSFNQSEKTSIDLKKLPVRRLRQILRDSDNISSLWKMIRRMKTSDISSESKGKLKKSIELMENFYGKEEKGINFEKMIQDKRLLDELEEKSEVFESIQSQWKAPLSTLLHIIHYQKGGN